jgi:thymidine kinase
MRRMTRAAAHAAALSPDVLPLDLDMCPIPPHPSYSLPQNASRK